MKSVILCSLAAGIVTLASGSVFAADNWEGTWKLNLAKSKFPSGAAPKSLTLSFEKAPDGIKLTSDGADAKGEPMHTEYTSKFDGTSVPWTGNPNADMAAPKRIDANHYRNVWKKDGKVTVTARVAVSPNGKILTVIQTGKDAQGKVMNVTEVFDRE